MESIEGKENTLTSMSPKILKPKPVCLSKKPRRILSSQPLSFLDVNTSNSVPENIFRKNSPTVGINPFRICSGKRKRNYDVKNEDESPSPLNQPKNKLYRLNVQDDNQNSVISFNENANLEFDRKFLEVSTVKNKESIKKREKLLPVDWSLKTKIRLISEKPFPWRTNFKTSEEASGTTGFVRCLHSENQVNSHCGLDSSFGAKFYQQCLVWTHPFIPWMTLFPRTDRSLTSNSSIPPLSPLQQEIFHSKWCDSLRSLYQLVRTCQCPYFYVCAASFTIVFRAAGVGSIVNIHAAIAPTTKGLRNALTEEGIEFTMPLNHGPEHDVEDDNDKSCLNDNSVMDDNETEETDSAVRTLEEDEPKTWLESLGLSQDDFPSLHRNRSKMRRENRKTIDRRSESLVYVEDADTQSLVNFLLNYSSCMSKIGPLAGVPPTLLSPIAFLGSTLQAHKIHHSKINTGGKEYFAVELNGPLLPNSIHSLCSLFNTTQDGDFNATLTSHSPTLPFSTLQQLSSTVPSAFATENLKDCGLPGSFITQMCSNSIEEMNQISAEEGLFTWT